MDFSKFYDEIYFDAHSSYISKTKATEGDVRSRGFFVRVLQGSQQADISTASMEGHFKSAKGKKVKAVATKEGGHFKITIPQEVFDAGGTALGELVLFGSTGEEIASDTFHIKVSESIRYAPEDESGGVGDSNDKDFTLLVGRVDRLERRVTTLEDSGVGGGGGLTEEEIKLIKVNQAKDADTVSGFTVAKNVPTDAKFTDTVVDVSGKAEKTYVDDLVQTPVPPNARFTDTRYTAGANVTIDSNNKIHVIGGGGTGDGSGLSPDEIKLIKINEAFKADDADTVSGHTVRENVPTGAVFTDTTYSAGRNVSIDGDRRIHADFNYIELDERIRTTKVARADNADNADNANLVNNHSVDKNVPASAVFTDTTYTAGSGIAIDAGNTISVDGELGGGLSEAEIRQIKVNRATMADNADDANTITGYTVAKNVPADAKFTDTIATKSSIGLKNVDNVKQMPISGGVLENYSEKQVNADDGVIDLSKGNVFYAGVSNNLTFDIINKPPRSISSFTLLIYIGMDSPVVTFPSSVIWGNDEIPDMSEGSKSYVLTFVWGRFNGKWLGMFGGAF